MTTKWLGLPLIALLPMAAAAQAPATAPKGSLTAEEIVAKAVAARGGLAKIKAVQSQRITGTISFHQGAQEDPGAAGPFVAEFKRPGKMRNELTVQGKKIVRIYDGSGSGWMINPFTGNENPQPMTDLDMRNAKHESDFDGPIVDSKEKGNTIEAAGTENVEGKDTYKLKITHKDGMVSYYFFDKETLLLAKWSGTIENAGQNNAWETLFHDYRDVEGLKFAFELVSSSPDIGLTQKISVEKIEVNPRIDESRFTKPAVTPASN